MSANIRPTPDLLRVCKRRIRPEIVTAADARRRRRFRFGVLSLERIEELATQGNYRHVLRVLLRERDYR